MIAPCPKCGFAQDGTVTCPRCGLVFERYRARPERLSVRAPAAAPAPEPPDEPRPSTFRRVYRVFRWVSLLACVLVVVLILKRSAPPPVSVDAEAPGRLAGKLDALAQSTARGEPHTLTLAEPELNAWLRQNLAMAQVAGAEELALPVDAEQARQARSNVRDLRVQLSGDLLRAWLVFDFHGQELSLLLEGRLRAEQGYLRFEPTAAMLGSLPLPRATLDRAVGRLFDEPANRESFRLPQDVRDVRVEGGELVLDRW